MTCEQDFLRTFFWCLTLGLIITILVSHVLNHPHISTYLVANKCLAYLSTKRVVFTKCIFKECMERFIMEAFFVTNNDKYKDEYNIHSIEHAYTNHDLQVLLWKFNDFWLESFHLWECIDIKIKIVIVVKCQKWCFGSIPLQCTSIVVMCIDFS